MSLNTPRERASSGSRTSLDRGLTRWNRKLHFYLGLYLLFFVWLFSVSGLLLNHPDWAFAHGFWDARERSTFEREIAAPRAAGEVAVAREVMGSLGIAGEIQEVERPATGDGLEFQVVRPGRVYAIELAAGRERVVVEEADLDAWGVMDALHKFTGVSLSDPDRQRDWFWTRIWSAAMDAVAIGLLFLVGSGVYMWLRPGRRLPGGGIALTLGAIACGLFLLGFGVLL